MDSQSLLQKVDLFYKLSMITEADIQNLMWQALHNKHHLLILQDYIEEQTGERLDENEIMNYIHTNYKGNTFRKASELQPGDGLWFLISPYYLPYFVRNVEASPSRKDYIVIHYTKDAYKSKSSPSHLPENYNLNVARAL